VTDPTGNQGTEQQPDPNETPEQRQARLAREQAGQGQSDQGGGSGKGEKRTR